MDFINIYDNHNKKKKMEVVTTFNIEESDDTYLIYRELDASKYYLAKFKKNSKKLITDLSEKEYRLCKTVFEGLIK